MGAVDDYLAMLPASEHIELERIRRLVKEFLPEAKEVISYGMPGFKYKNKYLLGYAAFKDHLSLFPTSQPIELLQDALEAYTTSKGTIQFTLDNPLPDGLIRAIVDLRAQAISTE